MLNKCMFIGHLGRDAELRYTTGGTAVANFSLATTEKWKDANGQKQEKTEWVKAVLWGKTAEALQQYLVKGKQVYIEGRMETRKWSDKDGNDRYTTEIKVNDIKLMGGGGTRDDGSQEREGETEHTASQERPAPSMAHDDDIPF
jgi:single-strand DNA-binding protein